MRIVHVTTVHKPFDSRIYYKEVRSLADAGYDVALATTVEGDRVFEGTSLLALGERSGSRWRRLARGVRALALMLREPRRSILHIHDPELLLPAFLPALMGHPLVFDVHEFYRERLATSHWIPSFMHPFAARLYDRLERNILSRFAGIVIVAESMRERYLRVQPDERIALVRNYPNISASESQSALSSVHPLGGTPYIVHTGGASRLRAYDVIIETAEYLREHGCDWPIVNIGLIDLSAYDPQTQSSLTARANAARVRNLGILDQAEAYRYVAHAAIGYLPLTRTHNYAQALPIKLFEYLFFGIPIVASDIGKTAEIITATGAGIVVSPEDACANGRALNLLATHADVREGYATRAKEAAPGYVFAPEFERLRSLYALVERKSSLNT